MESFSDWETHSVPDNERVAQESDDWNRHI
jgi:hypothetical protein